MFLNLKKNTDSIRFTLVTFLFFSVLALFLLDHILYPAYFFLQHVFKDFVVNRDIERAFSLLVYLTEYREAPEFTLFSTLFGYVASIFIFVLITGVSLSKKTLYTSTALLELLAVPVRFFFLYIIAFVVLGLFYSIVVK